jgi:hypothetical protein
MKPSNNWTSTLIKLIQESEAETGKEFYQFLNDLWLEDMGRVFDSHLIKALKEML